MDRYVNNFFTEISLNILKWKGPKRSIEIVSHTV